jgi:hypothetical protein
MLYLEYSQGELHRHTYLDFAGDIDNAKSTRGYTFLIGGGAICYSSNKQSTVTTLITYAKYLTGFEVFPTQALAC